MHNLCKTSAFFLIFEILLHIRPEYTIDDYLEGSEHANKKDVVFPCKSVLCAIVLLGTVGMNKLRNAFKKNDIYRR